MADLPEPTDEVDIRPEPWPGIRPHHVSRVAAELLDNAIRHGKRPVSVRAYRQGREGALEVTDAGDFSPDPFLFAPFVQEDMSAHRRQGGLGLGLFVSSRLCETSGGRLDFRRTEAGTMAEARFLLAG